MLDGKYTVMWHCSNSKRLLLPNANKKGCCKGDGRIMELERYHNAAKEAVMRESI
jgi:hypothetical protein